MYAGSLLGGTQDVERRTEELLSATTLAGESDTWRHAVAVRAVLLDLAELLRANAPIPIGADEGDERFRVVLDALYRSGGCSSDRLRERLPDGGDTLDELAAADRVAVVDSWVVVPLEAVPENWPAVISFLWARFDGIASDVRRIRDRLLADGASEDAPLVRTWSGLVGMIEVMVELLGRLSNYGRYIDERDREDDSGATEFASWTIAQLTEET